MTHFSGVGHSPTIVQYSTRVKDTSNQVHFKIRTFHGALSSCWSLFYSFLKRNVEAVNSPLKGSIRTAAETAAGSGPKTASTFCRLLQTFPSSTSSATGTNFTWVSARGLAPPRPTTRWLKPWLPGGEGGTSIYSFPLRMPCGQRGETSSLLGGKKFVGMHAAKISAAFRYSGPFLADVTSPSCLSRLSVNPACVWGGSTGSCAMTKVAAGWIHQKIGGVRVKPLLRVCAWVHVPREGESMSARGCKGRKI